MTETVEFNPDLAAMLLGKATHEVNDAKDNRDKLIQWAYDNGMSYRQIAEAANLPLSTVYRYKRGGGV
jgi:DNA invertase Pin-like site-specific DNA recombinase